MDFSQIKIIGHAGMGLKTSNSVYHDNSKESVEYALLMPGCDGVEVDVQLSKDGELWLYHDPFLETETKGSGCINQKISSELIGLKYKSFHQEKLCRLKELNTMLLKDKKIFLDVRNLNNCTNSLVSSDSLLNALDQISFLKDSTIHTFIVTNDVGFLQMAHFSGYETIFELDDISKFNSIKAIFPALKQVLVKNKSITIDQVAYIQNQGVEVTLFEMRSASGIRSALKKYPRAIMTDDLRESIIEVH